MGGADMCAAQQAAGISRNHTWLLTIGQAEPAQHLDN